MFLAEAEVETFTPEEVCIEAENREVHIEADIEIQCHNKLKVLVQDIEAILLIQEVGVEDSKAFCLPLFLCFVVQVLVLFSPLSISHIEQGSVKRSLCPMIF